MDIMKIGMQLLGNKLGGGIQQNLIQGALGKLMGGGNSEAGGVDLQGLVGKMKSGGLESQLGSWLGQGQNEEISEEQVEGVFGKEKIEEAAKEMGTDKPTLLAGLKDMLPQMVDQASPKGALLEKLGGLGDIAGKFMK